MNVDGNDECFVHLKIESFKAELRQIFGTLVAGN